MGIVFVRSKITRASWLLNVVIYTRKQVNEQRHRKCPSQNLNVEFCILLSFIYLLHIWWV